MIITCYLSQFCQWAYNDKLKKDILTWKWGRLNKNHTYIIIFSLVNNKRQWEEFQKVKDQVNIVKEIGPCWNTIHPDVLRNVVVIFEKKATPKNESGGSV